MARLHSTWDAVCQRQAAEATATSNSHRELLMVGTGAKTYRIADIVRKEYHILDDRGISDDNLKACKIEACVYQILGPNSLIAKCLEIGNGGEFIELEYYPHGNLKNYMKKLGSNLQESQMRRWARQMAASVAYIHGKGVRHSDLRLDQWLVDDNENARLSDFNASGFDKNKHMGIEAQPAIGFEGPRHFLPRDPEMDNTFESDVFALGSSLYELSASCQPFAELSDAEVYDRYSQMIFPTTKKLLFGDVISRCWRQETTTAQEVVRSLAYETPTFTADSRGNQFPDPIVGSSKR